MQDDLPYVFDLFFDIKTRDQLVKEVAQLHKRLEGIRNMMSANGIIVSQDELDKAWSEYNE